MRLLRCVIVTLLLLLFLLITTISAENIYVTSYIVEKNETITIPVYVNVSENIVGLDITLKFDPNVVVVQDVKLNGSYQCKAGCFWFENTGNDFVKVALIDTNGIKAKDIPVIDVNFKVVGNPGDITEIRLYANLSDSNYNLIRAETSNGFITIAGQHVTTTTVVATTTTAATTTTVTETTTTVTATVTEPTTTTIPMTTTATITSVIKETETTTPIETTPKQTTLPYPKETEQTIVIENKTEKAESTKSVQGFTIILCLLSIAIAFILCKRT